MTKNVLRRTIVFATFTMLVSILAVTSVINAPKAHASGDYILYYYQNDANGHQWVDIQSPGTGYTQQYALGNVYSAQNTSPALTQLYACENYSTNQEFVTDNFGCDDKSGYSASINGIATVYPRTTAPAGGIALYLCSIAGEWGNITDPTGCDTPSTATIVAYLVS